MSKLTRATQKLFGSTASANQIAKFGSFAAGTPARYSGATVTPDLIQALSNYLAGWNSAVVAGNSPSIEDMNALCYLFSYQTAYLLQQGVAEWDAATTYFIGSLATNSTGIMYVSLTNNNLNNLVTDTGNWQIYADSIGQHMTAAGAFALFNVQQRAYGTNPGQYGVMVSTSSGSFTSSSTTYVDITNLTGTFIVSVGAKPICIQLIPNPTVGGFVEITRGGTPNYASIQFVVGATAGGDIQAGSAQTSATNLVWRGPPSGFSSVVTGLAAGTYTIKAQAKVVNSGTTINVQDCLLTAFEF